MAYTIAFPLSLILVGFFLVSLASEKRVRRRRRKKREKKRRKDREKRKERKGQEEET